ncbi:lytic murein transglycosylase [Alishewanella sp. BS5-314]|uniref:lytic murein transglycosylase n=1 Tax=Alishewanella sp. BS5-314 TaxID=2755587 RepID=UPI0021BB83EA|nr:lytic murein transglycosylase [Alishewanella sp. BS5-314]MCT8126630.1 lytic murein transglycosylase [Alishewanella sp. BS5-314]
MKKKLIASLLLAAGWFNGQSLAEEAKPDFQSYTAALKAEAQSRGYDQALLEAVFSSLQFHERVVSADRSQPEVVETLDTYLPKRVSETRIRMARERYQQYQPQLEEIGKRYGVQPRFIVALWGLESSFGRFQGNYSIPSALATLAYEGRREAFFRTEFFHALDILAQGHIDLENMKGSWAGAMGQSQFMPSSFLAYAQDGDGDGKKDIWTNELDVFASIAYYLKRQGWNNSLTWGREVTLPAGFDAAHAIQRGSLARNEWLSRWDASARSMADWHKLGVRRLNGEALPQREISAALVLPDGPKGRAFLAYDNYKSLMHWNRSYYFVTSVGYLADLIVAEQS